MRKCWAIGLLACVSCGVLAQADNLAVSEQDRETIETRLEQIAVDLINLREQRGDRNHQLDQLFAELKTLEGELLLTRTQLKDNRAALADTSAALMQLEQQELQQSTALARQQQELGKQLNAAYRLGRQSRLKLLLNLESANRLTRMLAYHERFSEQRTELIADIQQQLVVLADTRAGIVQRREQIERLNQQYERELDSLAAQQQQQQSLAENIRGELGNIDNRIGELQLNQQELETLLANLQDLFADIPDELNELAFAELRGQLAWPVQQARPQVTARFGQTRTAGVTWSGIFIDSPEDQPVYAVARGRVAFADWLRGFGWLIIIDHNDGYMSLYGNNKQLLYEVGSWVAPGEQVALSGSGFGAESRSGVYFELRRDGRAYNPEPWLVDIP